MGLLGVESQLLTESALGKSSQAGVEHEVSLSNRFERVLTGIEVFLDWFTVVLAVSGAYAAYHFLNLGKGLCYNFSTLAYISCAVALLYVILLDRDGAYRPGNSLLRIKETERSLRVSSQAFLLIFPVTFFSSYLFSRWVFFIAALSVPLLQVLEKQLLFLCVDALRARNIGVQNVLIYGAGANGRRVLSALLRSRKLGLKPVALVDDNPELEGQEVFEDAYRRGPAITVIRGPLTKELIQHYQCGMLIIAIPSLGREKFASAVNAAQAAGVRLAYTPGHAIAAEYWTEYADLDGIMLSVFGRPASKWQYEATKRIFDLVVSILLIILLTPISLLIAILIKCESPGPVFFRQKRVGKDGKLFTLYKFRSMHVNAPQYHISPTEPNDPRITRIGRLLRRTSLDELAQLINVVIGDMSLVGPRPEMPFIVAQYTAAQRQRLRVKPAITGVWQLSADRAFQIHENIQYDLYYIQHRSFFMDCAILLHTFIFAMHGV